MKFSSPIAPPRFGPAIFVFAVAIAAPLCAQNAEVQNTNVVQNSAMSERDGDKIRGWNWSKAPDGSSDAALFSSAREGAQNVIRFQTPGRYAVAQQGVILQPNSAYRLSARVKGAPIYLRVRYEPKDGKSTQMNQVQTKASTAYVAVETRFLSRHGGPALLIIGATEEDATGACFIADLKLTLESNTLTDGPAIPLPVNADTPLRVRKIAVADCRAVRGFMSTPIDGKLDSPGWNGAAWEYPQPAAGAGVGYEYRSGDGLHLTLDGDAPVNAIQIRPGAMAKLFGAGADFRGPQKAPLRHTFRGPATVSRAVFQTPQRDRQWSFFEVQSGTLSDISFFNIATGTGDLPAPETWSVSAVPPTSTLAKFRDARFDEAGRATFSFAPATPGTLPTTQSTLAAPVAANATIHWQSAPLDRETPLAAIGLDFRIGDVKPNATLRASVQDPLNPRAELMGADFSLSSACRVRLVLDFPDQIVPAATPLWISLSCDQAMRFEGAPQVQLFRVSRERALPQAIAYRKLMLKGFFIALSEARPWGNLNKGVDREAWLAARPDSGEQLRELFETVAQARSLAPNDDEVRQYDEWIFRSWRGLTPFEPKIATITGAPEWAIVARQAWLEARKVPQWWLDNRLVPTGEFGGQVGDDTDMYQNFADFPFLENGAWIDRLKSAATDLMNLAERENLARGLNRRTTDPLHAYEEGINHRALMSLWHYGDAKYFERLLESAHATQSLMIQTSDGRTHFRSQKLGAEDVVRERPVDSDGDAHPLMLHPLFEVARYNRNPRALQLLTDWGQTWLPHQKPGAYATLIDVKSGQVLESGKRPLQGGYGTQASAFAYLFQLTHDAKWLRPFFDGWQNGEANTSIQSTLADWMHAGALANLGDKRPAIVRDKGMAETISTGDKKPLIDALKRDIAELQRFPAMYTTAEPFTDRVFLYAISNAAICYTGGSATRNKMHHSHAISYENMGTNFAALVLRNTPRTLKVLLYNFDARPLQGRVRLWSLEHGNYRLTLGDDPDGDDRAQSTLRDASVEISRATPLAIQLPPRRVLVLELAQTSKLDDERERADLALSADEIKIENGAVRGVAHNIGSREAPCEVALVDTKNKIVARQNLGTLEAPLDLRPRRKSFALPFPAPSTLSAGWRVVLDAGNKVPEIFEANNAALLPRR